MGSSVTYWQVTGTSASNIQHAAHIGDLLWHAATTSPSQQIFKNPHLGCHGCASDRCNASFVDASCYLDSDGGHNATRALAAAIASRAYVVSVPDIGMPWVVAPISGVSFYSPTCHGGYLDHPIVFCLGQNFSHRTLRFEPGAVVEAQKGAFRGMGDSLLSDTVAMS